MPIAGVPGLASGVAPRIPHSTTVKSFDHREDFEDELRHHLQRLERKLDAALSNISILRTVGRELPKNPLTEQRRRRGSSDSRDRDGVTSMPLGRAGGDHEAFTQPHQPSATPEDDTDAGLVSTIVCDAGIDEVYAMDPIKEQHSEPEQLFFRKPAPKRSHWDETSEGSYASPPSLPDEGQSGGSDNIYEAEKSAGGGLVKYGSDRKKKTMTARSQTRSYEKDAEEPPTNERRRSRVTVLLGENHTQLDAYAKKIGWQERAQKLKDKIDNPTTMPGWNFIHGTMANMVCSFVILLNAMFIGWSATRQLETRMNGESPPTSTIFAGECVFSMFFLVEIIVRMSIEKLLFFLGPEWRWNLFDTLLVGLSVVDVALTLNADSSFNSNLTQSRMVRLVRFFRLARITRVVRHFAKLRLVLFAILDSMSNLLGCFVIIGLTQYVFAVLFMSTTSEFYEPGEAPPDAVADLKMYYGGFVRTMLTLFMVISGGLDWAQASKPFETLGQPGLVMIFIFFVFLMQFGVLNVVVGAFVATAGEIANKDRETLVKFELQQWEIWTQRIRSFFVAADTDKSGTLSWEEFRAYLKDRRVKAYFQTMDLDVSQAHVLFELLDSNGNNQVTIDEFLDGCMRLKGQAKSIDLNMLMLMNRRLQDNFTSFMKASFEQMYMLEDRLTQVCETIGMAETDNVSENGSSRLPSKISRFERGSIVREPPPAEGRSPPLGAGPELRPGTSGTRPGTALQ